MRIGRKLLWDMRENMHLPPICDYLNIGLCCNCEEQIFDPGKISSCFKETQRRCEMSVL